MVPFMIFNQGPFTMNLQVVRLLPGHTIRFDPPRLNRKEGAQFRPLFCLSVFLLLVRSLFSFLVWRALFLEPSFRLFFSFWLQKRVFHVFLLYFCSRPLSALFFVFFKAPSFFFLYMEGSFFRAFFSSSLFFFAPSFLFKLTCAH